MWCSGGHQVPIPSVKTVNARSIGASTVIDVRTDVAVDLRGHGTSCSGCSTAALKAARDRFQNWSRYARSAATPVRIDAVDPARARRRVGHEPRVLEHLEVLGHGRSADGQLARQLADGARSIGKPLEDRAPGRVAQRCQRIKYSKWTLTVSLVLPLPCVKPSAAQIVKIEIDRVSSWNIRVSTAPPLVRDVLLRDGSTLRLRAPQPEDLADIKSFYDERLSDESRYMRFHGYMRTEVAARAYAEANGSDRVALIGRHGDHIVAAASYDLLREPGAAEIAFAVAEEFRGRGTATRMLEQLAAIAAERGVRRFDAEVLAMNRPMLLVFERAGFAVRRKGMGGEVTVSLDIRPTRKSASGSTSATTSRRSPRYGRSSRRDPWRLSA